MKKLKAFGFALLLFFTSSVYVNAACDATETNELNSLATNVNVDYEVLEGKLNPDEFTPPDGLTDEELEEFVGTYSYYRIYISNVTEDLYVVVTNELNGQSTTYTYENSNNGVITIDYDNMLSITNFTITVYSSSKTNCPDTKLYTTYLVTPMFNEYSTLEMCDGYEDFYLCHDFLKVPSVGFDKFLELLNEYKAGKINNDGEEIPIEEEEGGFTQFLKDNAVIIIVVGVVIVTAGGLITYVVIKKQRSRII